MTLYIYIKYNYILTIKFHISTKKKIDKLGEPLGIQSDEHKITKTK
jgi:hypothetical protein